jgi:hypothetical protein
VINSPVNSAIPSPAVRSLIRQPLPVGECRSIGTNGYVSTWGAILNGCPPQES